MDFQIRRCNKKKFVDLGGIPMAYYPSSTMYYVAVQEGEMIGSVSFTPNFFPGRKSHYFMLNLRSRIKKQGVGSRLIQAVESEALRNGIQSVGLKFKDAQFWKNRGYEVDSEYGEAWKQLT